MESNQLVYSQPVIKGKKYTKMMPEGYALVLEGGGTRGFYTSGVFEAFMDAGIMFPYIAGVSAGAANAITYISGQQGRSRMIVERYVGDRRYLSYRNLITHGSLFGFDFIFNTIPEKHIFWDRDVYEATDTQFFLGATDCRTGECVWFDKTHINKTSGFDVAMASCAVPIVSKIVKYGGYDLLDGGICAPIPIKKSIEDGNRFHVIVLTRNKDYSKESFSYKSIMKLMYGKYPKLIEAMMNRHIFYNEQLALCEQLEKEGKAMIIRPLEPLAVGRTTRDIDKLLYLYDEGHREGAEALKTLMP